MKHIVGVACMALLIAGCTNGKPADKQSEEYVDTISSATNKVGYQYTPEELDSLALCAWGDLKFGISQKEAKKVLSLREVTDMMTRWLVVLTMNLIYAVV